MAPLESLTKQKSVREESEPSGKEKNLGICKVNNSKGQTGPRII